MNRSPIRDFIVGLSVLVALLTGGYWAVGFGNPFARGGAPLVLYAAFDNTGELHRRAPVVIDGVKVGEVGSIALDANDRAGVALDLEPGLKIPIDTTASIVGMGLLGNREVALEIGKKREYLPQGGHIQRTKPAVILEELIGQLLYR